MDAYQLSDLPLPPEDPQAAMSFDIEPDEPKG